MKQKIIQVECSECSKIFETIQYWYGHKEICDDCIKQRDLRDRCKRHKGRDGKNCMFCELEAKF